MLLLASLLWACNPSQTTLILLAAAAGPIILSYIHHTKEV